MSHAIDLSNVPADHRLESDSMGQIPVPNDRYYGAQTARSLIHFDIGTDRMPLEVVHAFGVLKKACALVNQDLGKMKPETADLIVAGGGRGFRRKARRSFSAARLADRQRHAEQHERQRGHLQPRDRDGGRQARLEEAGPSERPREHVAILQRHLSRRHVHRRRAGDRAHAAARGEEPARRARRQGEGIRLHREDRPHPPDGRHAAHARPGIFRLRLAARRRPEAHRDGAARPGRTRARRQRRRHGAEHASRIRRPRGEENRRADQLSVRLRAEQIRRALRARRARHGQRRAQDARRVADEDRQRRALARQRPALRPRRDSPCRKTSPVPPSCRARSTPPSARP